jgi:hypothetical protein
MNKSILAKQKKAIVAQMALTATVRAVQKKCKHNQQAECDYVPCEFGNSSPPIRICLDCGLTEEGWGCGYKVLKNQDPFVGRIGRDKLYQLRFGVMIDSELKGPLIRGESSLDEVIDGNGKRDERDW